MIITVQFDQVIASIGRCPVIIDDHDPQRVTEHGHGEGDHILSGMPGIIRVRDALDAFTMEFLVGETAVIDLGSDFLDRPIITP